VQFPNFVFSLSWVLFLAHNSMQCCIHCLVISTSSEVVCCYLLLKNWIPSPKNPCLETFKMYFNGQNNNNKNTKTMVIIKNNKWKSNYVHKCTYKKVWLFDQKQNVPTLNNRCDFGACFVTLVLFQQIFVMCTTTLNLQASRKHHWTRNIIELNIMALSP